MFSFGVLEAFDLKGIIKLISRKGITSAMECVDVANFSFAT